MYYLVQEFHEASNGDRTLRDEHISVVKPRFAADADEVRHALAEDGSDSLGYELLTVTKLGEGIPKEHQGVVIMTELDGDDPPIRFVEGRYYAVEVDNNDHRFQYQATVWHQYTKELMLLFRVSDPNQPRHSIEVSIPVKMIGKVGYRIDGSDVNNPWENPMFLPRDRSEGSVPMTLDFGRRYTMKIGTSSKVNDYALTYSQTGYSLYTREISLIFTAPNDLTTFNPTPVPAQNILEIWY